MTRCFIGRIEPKIIRRLLFYFRFCRLSQLLVSFPFLSQTQKPHALTFSQKTSIRFFFDNSSSLTLYSYFIPIFLNISSLFRLSTYSNRLNLFCSIFPAMSVFFWTPSYIFLPTSIVHIQYYTVIVIDCSVRYKRNKNIFVNEKKK